GRASPNRAGRRPRARWPPPPPPGGGWLRPGPAPPRAPPGGEPRRAPRLLMRPADLPALAEDEYYHHEVVGFTVETLDGTVVGTIAGTMTNGLHDVWEVRAGAREHLIPVVADVVRAIDRAARRVRIDPTPGLLD